MKYLFELSKEYNSLPQAEVISCLKAEKINYNLIETNEDVVVIETDASLNKMELISNRLASVYFINQLLFSSDPSIEKIEKIACKNNIDKKGSIAIKYRNRSKYIKSQTIVERLADIYSKNRIVNLENPDIEIRAVITDSIVYVGIKIFELKRSQFEHRKVQFRPFFSPISLHPKLARIMVNLSLIKKGDILLDPFCGTGGILLEAGLIGAKVIGSDVELKMIEGSRDTLKHYKIKDYKLFRSDIGDISNNLNVVDSVVTDFPYGKSTTTKGENMSKLYTRAFKSISGVLKKKGILIAGLPNPDAISLGKKYLKIFNVYEIKVHASLTRYFALFYKNNKCL